MTMSLEEIQESNKFREDPIRCLAWRVSKGEAGDFLYSIQDGKFLMYNKGYWKEIRDIELLSRIENGLLDKDKNKICTKLPIARRKLIIENYKLLQFKYISDFNNKSLLNLENYMFDPVGINVLKHDKEYLSTIRVPYKYDGLAKCELWIKTLKEILEGDNEKISALQEFFGYCLTKDVTMEKALLLLGESRSGKSTILNTLQYMIGDENCSHVGLMNLENPQYTSMMINKLVNIDGEVSKKASDYEAQFKTIVTGHEVNCNDKYMPPFKFRPFCKFVMSANEFPKITDHSSAFYKRLILIPCNRVFEEHEQDRQLRNKLLLELPGILNWAIEGLKRLNIRGRFESYNFMKQAVDELENENNPAYIFFDEHINISMGNYVVKSELYDKYKQWSQDTKNYPLSENRFSQCVFKKYSKQTSKDARLGHGGKRVWKNIEYLNFKSPCEPTANGSGVQSPAGNNLEEIKWEE